MHMRRFSDLLAEVFEAHGYQVSSEASLEGRSGTIYTPPLLAERQGRAIVVEPCPVGRVPDADAVHDLATVAADVGADLGLLVHVEEAAPDATAGTDGRIVLWGRQELVRLVGEARLRSIGLPPSPLPLEPAAPEGHGQEPAPEQDTAATLPGPLQEALESAKAAALDEAGAEVDHQDAGDLEAGPEAVDVPAGTPARFPANTPDRVDLDDLLPPAFRLHRPRPTQDAEDGLDPEARTGPPAQEVGMTPVPEAQPDVLGADTEWNDVDPPDAQAPEGDDVGRSDADVSEWDDMDQPHAETPEELDVVLPEKELDTSGSSDAEIDMIRAADEVQDGATPGGDVDPMEAGATDPQHNVTELQEAPDPEEGPRARPSSPAKLHPESPDAQPRFTVPVLRPRLDLKQAIDLAQDRVYRVARAEFIVRPVYHFDYECDVLRQGSLKHETLTGRIEVDGTRPLAHMVEGDVAPQELPPVAAMEGLTFHERPLRIRQASAERVARELMAKRHTRTIDVDVEDEDQSFSYTEKRKVVPTPDHMRLHLAGVYGRPYWRLVGPNGYLDLDALTGAAVDGNLKNANSDILIVD